MNILSEQTQQQIKNSTLQEQTLSDIRAQRELMASQLLNMSHILDQIPGAKLNDWKLAEVEYLLRLANQRVQLQHELSAANALFDAANKILAELDDPALIVVREKIASEMLLLGQNNQLDRQGIYSQIQAIKHFIHDNIQPPKNHLESAKAVIATKDDSLLTQLKSLVQIRYREEAFDAPLNTEQYLLLEHSLMLMLEQAQWALLKADQSLFENSLNNAVQWINTRLRHSQAMDMATELSKLAILNIQLNIPDVSQSLLLLRQVIQNRTYQPAAVTKPAEQAPNKKAESI